MKWLVKQKDEINSNNPLRGISFLPNMEKFCGKMLELDTNLLYSEGAFVWSFLPEWLKTPYVRVRASLHKSLYAELVGRKLTIKKEENYDGIVHFEETHFTCHKSYLEPWIDGEKWDSIKKQWFSPSATETYIVIRKEKGCGGIEVCSPTHSPKQHISEQDAIKEAKRLAKDKSPPRVLGFSVYKEIHKEKVIRPKYEIGTQLKVGKEPYEFEKNSVITITEIKDGYIVSGLVGITIGQKKIGIPSLEDMNLEVVFRVKDEIPF